MVFLRIEKCKFSIFWNRYDACPIASLRSKINYSKNGFKKDNLIWLMHFCQNNDDCSVYLTWKGTSSFFLSLFISRGDTKKCKFILHKWWCFFFSLVNSIWVIANFITNWMIALVRTDAKHSHEITMTKLFK